MQSRGPKPRNLLILNQQNDQTEKFFLNKWKYVFLYFGENYIRECFSPVLLFRRLWKSVYSELLKKLPGQIWPGKESEGARPTLGSDLPGIQVRLTRNPSQTDPESESDWPGIRVRKTFWTQIPVIFTLIPDLFDSRSGPMGPFPGSNLTREFLECKLWKCNKTRLSIYGVVYFIPSEDSLITVKIWM